MKFNRVPAGVVLKVKDCTSHIEVVRLIVAEGLRGHGLGTKAMRALQQLGRAIRLTAVPETRKKNALHRFYKRLGFQPVQINSIGQTEFVWLPGGAK